MILTQVPIDRVADHFVNYLFDDYKGSKHVRRVASWVGLILMGLMRAKAHGLGVKRDRQVGFKYGNRKFKAKYDHHAGDRGGIVIIEILPGTGSPEGDTVFQIESLEDAERFYKKAPSIFEKFVA